MVPLPSRGWSTGGRSAVCGCTVPFRVGRCMRPALWRRRWRPVVVVRPSCCCGWSRRCVEWRVSQVVGEVRGESGRGWGRGYVVVAVVLLLVAVAAGVWVGWGGRGAESDSRPGDGAVAGSASPPVVAGPVPPQVDPELVLGRSGCSGDHGGVQRLPVSVLCEVCVRAAAGAGGALRGDRAGASGLAGHPYLGEESVRAAVAARAAGRQGRYWDYHEASG